MNKAGDQVTILHLSDLQFGRHHRFRGTDLSAGRDPAGLLNPFNTLGERLCEDLEHLRAPPHKLEPDLIIVTGDFAEWALPEESQATRSFMVKLRKRLGLAPSRVIVVPGNHDVDRKKCEECFNRCSARGEVAEPPFPSPPPPPSKTDVPPPTRDSLGLWQWRTMVESRTADFVGRQWLFDKIDQRLADPDFRSGYIVIQGEPGIGKTALACKLVKDRGYLYHFNSVVTGVCEIELFRANLAQQLAERGEPVGSLVRLDRRAFATMLAEAAQRRRGAPFVVVVDALDEAKEPSIASQENVLGLEPDLPLSLYFIVTMREGAPVRLEVGRRQDISLLDKDPRNLADVREWIERFISRHQSEVNVRLREWRISQNELVELLTERSEGNFYYVHFVLPDIASGRLSSVHVQRAGDLPHGLQAYYERHRSIMRGADEARYREVQRPVLCALAAEPAPVSIELLCQRTELPPHVVADVIAQWSQFLNRDQDVDGTPLRGYRCATRS